MQFVKEKPRTIASFSQLELTVLKDVSHKSFLFAIQLAVIFEGHLSHVLKPGGV